MSAVAPRLIRLVRKLESEQEAAPGQAACHLAAVFPCVHTFFEEFKREGPQSGSGGGTGGAEASSDGAGAAVPSCAAAGGCGDSSCGGGGGGGAAGRPAVGVAAERQPVAKLAGPWPLLK